MTKVYCWHDGTVGKGKFKDFPETNEIQIYCPYYFLCANFPKEINPHTSNCEKPIKEGKQP